MVSKFKSPKLLVTLLILLFPFFQGCRSTSDLTASVPNPGTSANNSVWATAWGNSPENALTSAENPGGSEQSFRMVFWPTLSGTQERLHFSNFFGTAPITIGAARLGVSPEGTSAVDPSNDVAVRFGGATSITIPAGAIITSDAVNLTYRYGERLAVSMYVKGNFPALTQHDS